MNQKADRMPKSPLKIPNASVPLLLIHEPTNDRNDESAVVILVHALSSHLPFFSFLANSCAAFSASEVLLASVVAQPLSRRAMRMSDGST
jgi:hypothetical protein